MLSAMNRLHRNKHCLLLILVLCYFKQSVKCLVVKKGEKITTGILFNSNPGSKKEVLMTFIGPKQLHV